MGVSGGGASTKEGSFELPSVPRGSRLFTASIEPGDVTGSQAPVSATVSVVVDHDIDDFQLRFGAPFTIEASIESTGSVRGDDSGGVSVGLNAEDGYTLYFGRRQKEGIWRFENVVPGRYQITATPGLSGGYYLSSISVGGQEATGQFVNLQPGSPPIQVVYKPNASTVRGTVDQGDEKQVVLMPQGPLDSLAPDFGRVVQAGSGGVLKSPAWAGFLLCFRPRSSGAGAILRSAIRAKNYLRRSPRADHRRLGGYGKTESNPIRRISGQFHS